MRQGSPGPNNVMLATSGANFGYRRTLPHILGINLGVFTLTLVVCLGLGTVFNRYPDVHRVLKVVGSLYLVYLAWKLAGASISDKAGSSRPLTLVEGAAFQIVNPKSWMKAATIATVFLPQDIRPIYAALVVSSVGFVVGFPLISVWTLFGVAIRQFLRSKFRLRVFNAAMGLS
ncbi:LysE family translocator, partial [Streptococcus pyogenes]|uniref:LysE family translocator n=1 Tax=Streptococcus pyogenes TaxID=1314 RepID=UPI003D9FCC00